MEENANYLHRFFTFGILGCAGLWAAYRIQLKENVFSDQKKQLINQN